MTYCLTAGTLGIPTDCTPMPCSGKVILTFCGEHADSVSLNGRFYPIVDDCAAIPCEAFGEEDELVAHALADRRRYACGPIGRVGERGELVAPLRSPSSLLLAIGELLSSLSDRLLAAETELRAHSDAITRKPITFGGIQ